MVKMRGVQFPPMEEIKNCADSNNDGFSLMYNTKDGHVESYRTMNKDKFLKTYKRLSGELDPQCTAMVVHCRISTHGSNSRQNCHCWTLRDRSLGFAHNGVLSSIGSVKDMTDSETFFRYLFEPVFRDGGWASAELLIKGVIGYSKFAFLLGTGEVKTWGAFQRSAESGCYYSNGSYISWSRKTPAYGGMGFGASGSWGSDYPRQTTFPEYRHYLDNYYDND